MKKVKIIIVVIGLLLVIGFVAHTKVSKFKTEKIVLDAQDLQLQPAIEGDEVVEVAKIGSRTMKIDPQTTNISLYENGQKLGETLPGFTTNSDSSILKTPLVVNYKLTNTSASTSLSGYEESIVKKNFVIEPFENGVRVTYTVGEEVVPIDKLPQAVKKKRYEDILSKVSESDQSLLNSFYNYSSEKDAYIRPPEIKPSKVSTLYDIFYTGGGYTEEDLAEDNKILDNSKVNESLPVSFIIPVDFSLDENGDFKVRVDLSAIEFSGVEQLTSIDLLPGMMESPQGYFLVPDGSGAIIDTKTTKTANKYSKEFAPISQDVLGQYDDITSEKLSLPVFANEKILGIIENGASAANLNVDMSGKTNLIYPTINYQYSVFYELNTSGKGVNLTSKETDGTFDMIYKLKSDEQTYFDYAKTVQTYYQNKFNLTSQEFEPKTNLEVLGAYNFTNYLMGVPYDDLDKLSTVEDIKTMLSALEGSDEFNVIYYGWAKNGLNSNFLDTKLNKICSDGDDINSIPNLSLAVNMITLNQKYMGQFNPNTDVENGIEGSVNKMYPILNSSFEENKLKTPYYYLSPRKLKDVTSQFISKFDSGESIMVSDLASIGYADYKKNNEVLPLEAEQIAMESLAMLGDSFELGMKAPILEYGFLADNIIDLPTSSSNSDLFDYDIPFIQLVYNGLIPTSNTAVNLSDDGNVEANILHTFETKSNLDFVLSMDDTSKLKDTAFNKYYAVEFDYWRDIINEANQKYDKFLAEIDNGSIKNHQIIEENVSKVTYNNGKKAYFNYNPYQVTVDNVTIEANSYIVKGGN